MNSLAPTVAGYFQPFCPECPGKVTVRNGSAGLKMPDFALYDASLGTGWVMLRRFVLMVGLAAVGLALSGCTKCGPFWDDWLQSPKSCKSDRF